MNIRVMTYNIHHGRGMDKELDLKRIAEVISLSRADIIGLNEVDKNFSKRSKFMDQVDYLAKQLRLEYAFSPSLTVRSKDREWIQQYGNAVLSRFPIQQSYHHLFNFIPGLIEGRSILETKIKVYDQLVNVYVTHLSLNPRLHKQQAEYVLTNAKDPGIILGDWNMKPNSKKWRRVAGRYRDVWQEAGSGSGFTYPSTRPRTRLDYVFVTDDIKVVDAEVIMEFPIASDHLPLMSTLSF